MKYSKFQRLQMLIIVTSLLAILFNYLAFQFGNKHNAFMIPLNVACIVYAIYNLRKL